MTVNDDLKKLIKKKESRSSVGAVAKKPKEAIDTTHLYQFVSLGIRIALVYVFYIFIGKLIVEHFNLPSAMLIAIILATVQVVYIIFRIIKGFK